LGRYSDCLNFRHEIKESESIRGQYCTIGFRAMQNSSFNSEKIVPGFDWREMQEKIKYITFLFANFMIFSQWQFYAKSKCFSTKRGLLTCDLFERESCRIS
jgi:hypothetical protein